MLSISELPRKDGLIDGNFRARHKSESFSLEGFGFKFVDGVTVDAVAMRVHDRLHAAYGGDVCFEPCDHETAEKVWLWLADRGLHEQRIAEIGAWFSRLFAPVESEAERIARLAAAAESERIAAEAVAAALAAEQETARLAAEAAAAEAARLEADAKAKADADELSKLEADIAALETAEAKAPDAPSGSSAHETAAPSAAPASNEGAAVASTKQKGKATK
jgi:hypothetical protein